MFVILCLAEESTDPSKTILPWLATTIATTAASTTQQLKELQQVSHMKQIWFVLACIPFKDRLIRDQKR